MKSTFAEIIKIFSGIIEVRRKLDAALANKAGRKLADGIDVKMCCFSDDMVAFTCAFHKEIEAAHISSVDDETKALKS